VFEPWLAKIVAKHARRGLLLDSNLFVVYCVGSIDPARIQQEKVTRHYNSNDFRILDYFIRRFAHLLTTPNIMTEVSNLSGHLRGDMRAVVRTALRENVVQVLREEYVSTNDAVQNQSFVHFGLTDAAINVQGQAGNLTLTDDLDLSILLHRQGSDCIHYTNALRFLSIDN
jgi:hypothetical protein